MSLIHKGMVAVASGNSSAIKRRSEALRNRSIQYAIARCLYDDPSAPTDHAELWVEKADVEKARSAIRKASADDKALIW